MISTTPVGLNDTVSLSGYAYALPQTTLKIEADIVTTRIIRGPFYRFAERYMGIRNVPQQSSVEFSLGSVRVESLTEADPSAFYLVRTVSGNPDLSDFLRLGREGLIIDVCMDRTDPAREYQPENVPGPMYFKDLSVHSNVVMSSDTLYKTILTDSTFIKVPVLRDQLIVRTIDEKAREAADLIFKLRKRRFHMISANYDFMPEGEAMVPVLRELDELEKEYLSLFIGKRYSQVETLTFYFTPDPRGMSGPAALFEFSRRDGLVSSPTANSKPLTLNLLPEEKTKVLKNTGMPIQGKSVSNALYYRVPDMARLELDYGSKNLITDRIPVYQYGAVLRMPLVMKK
jgi:hypothetical protein